MASNSIMNQTGLLVAILIASLLLLADLVGYVNWFKNARSYIVYPVQVFGAATVKTLQLASLSVVQGSSLKSENLTLRQKVLELEGVVAEYTRERELSTEFKEYLATINEASYAGTESATVLDLNVGNLQGKILLNKGEMAGISKGMPVVYGSYYIGVISEVTTFESTCITFLLPAQEFVGYVQKRNISGIVNVGINGMELRDLLANEKVTLHDAVTIKREGYPYFMTLGTIAVVPANNGSAERKAMLVSPVALSDLTFVTIVKK